MCVIYVYAYIDVHTLLETHEYTGAHREYSKLRLQ